MSDETTDKPKRPRRARKPEGVLGHAQAIVDAIEAAPEGMRQAAIRAAFEALQNGPAPHLWTTADRDANRALHEGTVDKLTKDRDEARHDLAEAIVRRDAMAGQAIQYATDVLRLADLFVQARDLPPLIELGESGAWAFLEARGISDDSARQVMRAAGLFSMVAPPGPDGPLPGDVAIDPAKLDDARARREARQAREATEATDPEPPPGMVAKVSPGRAARLAEQEPPDDDARPLPPERPAPKRGRPVCDACGHSAHFHLPTEATPDAKGYCADPASGCGCRGVIG